MKKLFSALMAVLLVLINVYPVNAAAMASTISSPSTARVIQVMDGESMRVRLFDTGEVALVRLIGVRADGRDDAFNYLNTRLAGRDIVLTTDPNVPASGRWHLVYATLQGTLINTEILSGGFASVNTSHRAAGRYRDLTRAQDVARANEAGHWNSGSASPGRVGSGVNINTATASQIRTLFSGVTSVVASNIVRHRERNPFNSIEDIKFVTGFTKDMFDTNRWLMTVSTNVNTASREELITLQNVTESMANVIVDRRTERRFSAISQLRSEGILSQSVYNANEPFISVSAHSSISVSVPDIVVNINTANRSQLMSIGLTSRQADALIQHRQGYSYKTLEELEFVPRVNLGRTRINELADNMVTMTDINNASLAEIRSLLGLTTSAVANTIYNNRPYSTVERISNHVSAAVYDSIKDFVYVGDVRPDRVNLNTASAAELQSAGFTASEAATIIRGRRIESPGNLPLDTSRNDRHVALYTNINAAGRNELMSLSPRMTEQLVDEILAYRDDQPFASRSELEEFFSEHNFISLYRSIRDFLVFR